MKGPWRLGPPPRILFATAVFRCRQASASPSAKALWKTEKGGRANPAEAVLYTADTVFDDGVATPTPRYDREKLKADDTVDGPAIITQHNSTTILPPGYVATVLGYGDIRIART